MASRATSRIIPYGKQSISFSDRIYVFRSLGKEFVTSGPEIESFERELSEAVESRFAVAFSSGTAGLHGAAAVAKILGFGRALVPNLTFAATANCFRYTDVDFVIGDISASDWNLDWAQLSGGFDIVAPVHFAGNPVNFRDSNFAGWKGLVIEDAAHALGARTPDGPVGNGSFGDMAVFSFHPVKAITTGEGGAVTTNDEEIAHALRLFRSHGINRADESRPWAYDIASIGFNYRMTEFQAALGRRQLKKLDRFIRQRNEVAHRYREALGRRGLEMSPEAPPGFTHAYHLFQVRVPDRDKVLTRLHESGIKAQVHYPPLSSLSLNDFIPLTQNRLAISEGVAETAISLPIFPGLTVRQQRRAISVLSRILDR